MTLNKTKIGSTTFKIEKRKIYGPLCLAKTKVHEQK